MRSGRAGFVVVLHGSEADPQQRPDAFDRVEVRRIAGELEDGEPVVVKRERAAVNEVFAAAVERGYVTQNPWGGLRWTARKPARSGSVPGTLSVASVIAVRSVW